MVQIGFEPKIAFLCPLCSKEVEMVYERGRDLWVSEHSGCLNFTVIRDLPRFAGRGMGGPLVFIVLESDFSIKETIEDLRRLGRDEPDQAKRQKLEAGIKRLESRLGFSERSFQGVIDAFRSGAFGVRVVSGRDIYAVLWKLGPKFMGTANIDDPAKYPEAVIATADVEEASKFIDYWLHYWEERDLA